MYEMFFLNVNDRMNKLTNAFRNSKGFITFLYCLFCGFFSFSQPSAESSLADQYYLDGEYENALELYTKLLKNDPSEKNILRVVDCMEILMQYDEAIRFLDKQIKRYDHIVILPIQQAILLEKTGKFKQSEKLLTETVGKRLKAEGQFMQVGSFLYTNDKLGPAMNTYLQGRKQLKKEYIFGSELANIQQQLGNYGEATKEYLNMYYESPTNLNNAKLEILKLADMYPEGQGEIEQALLRASDKEQGNLALRSILYEYYVLNEDFYEAFIQVKAIDRLFKEDGERIYNFAETMRNNKQYDLSNKAYDYIIDRKRDSRYYYQAHMGKAINGELKAFDKLPVDQKAVRQAVEDYEKLLKEFGRSTRYFQAIYRQANLMVFYLNQLDEALKNLQQQVNQLPRNDEWAQAQILIGDILLIQQSYNQSKAAYTIVSDEFSEGDPQLRSLAKFKLSQLSYYKGEFNLSQALLAAIKDNTSNDISNDAIQLNLLIIDNTGLDTSTTALEIFARAQLLSYQRQYEASLDLMDSLTFEFPNHPLADEILWEKAQIYLRQDEIDIALDFIDRIIKDFLYDIFGDDALYTKAKIYDYTLNDTEKAQELYLEFLATFPGSLFSVDVRKRIRELRQEG